MEPLKTDESADLLARLAELKADNQAEGLARLAAIDEAMTPPWRAAMQGRIDGLVHQASSPRTKLPKVYALMEEFGELRAPHVSCKTGCSTCCRRIPVEISDLEAEHISKATGIAHVALPPGRHTRMGFVDTPCPFLVNDLCSIYEHRPFNCRSLASVDRDALTCSDLNTELTRAKDPRAVPVVMSRTPQFDPVYLKLTRRGGAAWADIRQFFPQTPAGHVDQGVLE